MSYNDGNITLGSAEWYAVSFRGNKIPEDNVIETTKNNIGHTSSGVSIEYKPEKYNVENSYGKVVKSFITKEEVTAKTGYLTWNLANLKTLSACKYTVDKEKMEKKLVIGGSKNVLDTVLIRAVHTKEDGKKIRFTMIGQAGNGFVVEFSNKETVIDAEFTAIEKIRNYLCDFREEINEEEYEDEMGLQNIIVTAATGSSSNHNKVTIDPEKPEGRKLSYLVESSDTVKVEYNDDSTLMNFDEWDGTSEIPCNTGDTIYIVITDMDGFIKYFGKTTAK